MKIFLFFLEKHWIEKNVSGSVIPRVTVHVKQIAQSLEGYYLKSNLKINSPVFYLKSVAAYS